MFGFFVVFCLVLGFPYKASLLGGIREDNLAPSNEVPGTIEKVINVH